MMNSLISEEKSCEECGAIMQINHNETSDPIFCPFCRCEMLINIDMDEDAPWARLEEDDEDLTDVEEC